MPRVLCRAPLPARLGLTGKGRARVCRFNLQCLGTVTTKAMEEFLSNQLTLILTMQRGVGRQRLSNQRKKSASANPNPELPPHTLRKTGAER